MATIVVSKYGMKFYTRDCTKNAIGEQGETEGVLRHLVDAGHRVLYFGKHDGELEGVTFLEPHLTDLDDMSTAAHQEALWKLDTEMVGDHKPDLALQINGMAPTFSWIDNPRGARLQSFAVRMCGPWLNVLQSLKLNRMCINNDPRSYPRDQEMSYGWDYVRPSVLLDQCSAQKKMTVGGKDYLRVSHYAKAESFGWLPHRPNQKKRDVVIVAHSHFDDGLGSAATWPDLERLLVETDCTVYGKGWDGTEWQRRHPDKFLGPVKPLEVLDIVNEAKASYVCDHTPGFKTGKPYVLTSQGCVPCWSYNGVKHAIESYKEDIELAYELYSPDYSVLDEAIDNPNFGGGYVPR
jgi:hypothetical protein